MKATVLFFLAITNVISAQCLKQLNESINPASEFEGLSKMRKNDLPEFISEDSIYLNSILHKSAKIKSNKTDSRHLIQKNTGISKHTQNLKALIHSLNEMQGGNERIKLDSVGFYEPFNVSIYDSLNTGIFEIVKDENGFVTETISKTVDTISLEWNYENKRIFKNNEIGKTIERIDFEWDGTTWLNDVKTVFEYDVNGNEISSMVYDWDTVNSLWYLATKTITNYNEKNLLLSRYFYNILNFGEGVVADKTEYTYNENGKETSYIICNNWDAAINTWKYQNKRETIYNEEGNRTSYSLFQYDILTGNWKYNYKYEYEYYQDGSTREIYYRPNVVTNALELVSQIYYKYDRIYDGEKLIQEIRWQKNSENEEWYLTTKIEYKYSPSGNLIFRGYYTIIWGDYWELLQLQTYTESGIILKSETYRWDYELYKPIGTLKYEFQRDEDGRSLSYIRYKWNTAESQWNIDYKNDYQYSENGGYVEKKYIFKKTGEYQALKKEDDSVKLNYDYSIGKYISIKEEGYVIQISYNDNLKVDELITIDEREVESKIKCYYDSMQRDSLWEIYYNYDSALEYDFSAVFNYEIIEKDSMIVTEFLMDYNPENNYYTEKRFYYFNNGQLKLFKNYTQTEEFENWNLRDSIKYEYNEKGQIKTVFSQHDTYQNKEEYSILGDSLIVSYFYRYPDESIEWNLSDIDLIKIDTNYSRNQIQELPATIFFGEEDGWIGYFNFHQIFNYGKILTIANCTFDENDGLITDYLSEYYYSNASQLSGDGIINGYITGEIIGNKSISIGSSLNGNPMEGAVVSLCTLTDNFILATDTTSSAGFYEFKGVPNGKFYLKVYLPGFEQISTYNIELTFLSNVFRNKNFIVNNGELSTQANYLESGIKIYPNPASDFIDIISTEELSFLRIFNVQGQLQLVQNMQKSKVARILVNNLPVGIYFVEVKTDSKLYRQKLVIKN